METKSNQGGQFGCLTKAMPDEPMFILLGRDPAAPAAIKRWVKYRSQLDGQDPAQLSEAERDAEAFAQWRLDHDGEWRGYDPSADQIPTPSDELSSIAGTVAGMELPAGLTTEEVAKAGPEAKWVELDFALEIIAQARSLAGFVLNADPVAGPQDG